MTPWPASSPWVWPPRGSPWEWPPTVPLPSSPTPATILGPLLCSDFDVADPAIVLNAGNVESIPNRGLDTAPLTQATAAKRPAYSATSFNGGPGMTFDGIDDTLESALATPIPVGRRPYIWCVFRCTSTAVAYRIAAGLSGTGVYCVLWPNSAGGTFGGQLDAGAGFAGSTFFAATDLNIHLLEGGFTVSGLNAFRLDGVGGNVLGAASVPLTAAIPLVLAGAGGGAQFFLGVVRRIIVANELPSAQQLLDMRAYLRAQPYGLPP